MIILFFKVHRCDMNLHIEMQAFENPLGIKLDNTCCYSRHMTRECVRKCATFFRFCLRTTRIGTSKSNCLYEFNTDLIGMNSISKEQFSFTTDSIEFPIAAEHQNAPLQLSVEAHNNLMNSGDDMATRESELINVWSIELNAHEASNSWNEFNESNQLKHRLTLKYRLECANWFAGAKCEPVALPMCELKCQNGGVCAAGPNGYQVCHCPSSAFQGPLCEIALVSASLICDSTQPCFNGGTCLGDKCLCAPGYIGDKCQFKRLPNQCGPVTCYNGGTCVISEHNDYSCQCHPAFAGRLCEERIDLCNNGSNPCQNGGVCHWNSTQSSYECSCQLGFTGPNCSTSKQQQQDNAFRVIVSDVRPNQNENILFLVNRKAQHTTSSVRDYVLIGFGASLLLISLLVLVILKRKRRTAAKAQTCKKFKPERSANIYVINDEDYSKQKMKSSNLVPKLDSKSNNTHADYYCEIGDLATKQAQNYYSLGVTYEQTDNTFISYV